MLRNIRYVFLGVGFVFLAGAIIPDLQSFNGLGPVQSALLIAGVICVLWGLLGRNIGHFYVRLSIIVTNTLVAIIILETGIGLIRTGIEKLESRQIRLSDSAAANLYKTNHPYYSAQNWGRAMWQETNALGSEYHPFVLWREIPQAGTYVNVEADSRRLVPNTHCGSESAYTVFLFGGSTMFGIGAPDDMTIGAFLQARLQEALKTDVCIVVQASSGWVSTQGVIELIRQLQVGNYPDLVIFYDGYNDSLAAAHSGIPNGDFSNGKIAARFDIARRPSLSRWFLTSTQIGQTLAELLHIDTAFDANYSPPPHIKRKIDDIDRLAGEVAQEYLTNYQVVEVLAAQFDFDFDFFWQPALGLGEKPLTAFEKDLLKLYNGQYPIFEAVYAHVRDAVGTHSRLHDISDVFTTSTETLYSDTVHITPVGNELVAQQMTQFVLPELNINNIGKSQ